jgi:two-component system KDP operon response regulator KdpE
MSATRRRTLLLHGDRNARRVLRRSLQAHGFEVLTAADGERGLSVLLDELLDLDVLVLDADLPRRDGWALLRLIRAAGGERDLRVVVLGRGLDAGRCAQLRWLGADAALDSSEGAERESAAASMVAPASWPERACA